MNCTVFRERVFEFIEGLLPPQDEAAASAHLRDCAECPAHLASARQFGQLLSQSGDQAIEDWAAHAATRRVMAVAAKDARPGVRGAEPSSGMWVRAFPYAVAAAALIAAGVMVHSAGPDELSEGRVTVLARGDHMLAAPGCDVEGEDRADVLVPAGTNGEVVRMTAGSALFRVEPGRVFAVETPQGTASVLGTSFHVAVAHDRSVAVSVHSGRVKFAGPGGTRTLEPGERIEVDPRGAQRLVARSRVDELETALKAAEDKVRTLEEAPRKRMLKLLRETEMPSGPPAPETEDPARAEDVVRKIPWDRLGGAMRELLRRSHGWNEQQSSEHLQALGLVYDHTPELRQLTGEDDPADALWHPASLQRLAEPFCSALAPDAQAADRASAVDAIREAARQAQLRLGGRLVPMEAIVERATLRRAMLVAARDHLGRAAAVELAGALKRENFTRKGWAIFPMRLDDNMARGIEKWWVKELALTEDQLPALRAAITEYLESTVRVQDEIIGRIGKDAATKVLFPRMPVPGPSDNAKDAAPPEVDPDDVLQVLDLKLQLAQPRIEFERTMAALARPDQPQVTANTMSLLATFQRK